MNLKKVISKINKAGIRSAYTYYMRKRYIWKILPKVYKKYSALPVENKIVFMEKGAGISVNIRNMYEQYLAEGKYDVVLVTMGKSGMPLLDYYRKAKEFVKEISTAKVIYISTANDLLSGIKGLRPETKYVQLWHGCGILKKVGLGTIGHKLGKSKDSHKNFPQHKNYSFVTIASPAQSWIFESAMGIEKDSGIIVNTGVSRTDQFFNKDYVDNSFKKIRELIPGSREKKLILYAPTFRGNLTQSTAPNNLDIEAFADAFSEEYILIFKHHHTTKNEQEIPDKYLGTFAFDLTRGSGMDINEIMTVSDICISDYSSLVFEYSLFERPMLFFAYDLEEYSKDKGLYYDLKDIMPGPICKTNLELIHSIKDFEEKFDARQVIDFKAKYMTNCDGHSTDRIMQLVEK